MSTDTSRAAGATATKGAPALRAQILVEIRNRGSEGATCDEIENLFGLRHQTASARVHELMKDRLIVDSGARRKTSSECFAIVWVVGEPQLEPLLLWAGGKRWLVPKLRELYDSHRHRRLVEPFVGGMAVALGLRPECALLADVNPHLVNLYQWLQVGIDRSIKMENTSECYYSHREDFNGLIEAECDDCVEMAELFYYLNRSGFNGLCRFNKDGKFNVPYGKRKRVEYRETFRDYAPVLGPWDIVESDFRKLTIEPDDFLYIDPPYDGTFTDYSSGGFSWDDQAQLAVRFADHAGPVVVSNAATDRILALYRVLGFTVGVIDAPRSISANGNREPAKEMLATKNV